MKLDRHITPSGRGKYAVLNLRTNRIEWGLPGDPDEFFVLKLRDIYASAALLAYATEAEKCGDAEFAQEVRVLAGRSGIKSPHAKAPD